MKKPVGVQGGEQRGRVLKVAEGSMELVGGSTVHMNMEALSVRGDLKCGTKKHLGEVRRDALVSVGTGKK